MHLRAMAAILSLMCSPAYADPPIAPADQSERVSLARQYVALTHREQRLGAMWALSLSSQFLPVCIDPSCIAAVKAAAIFAASGSAHSAAERTIERYATGLTTEQLQALLRFANSPAGQAVTRLLDDSEDQMRFEAHTETVSLMLSFYHRFCATEASTCATSKAMRSVPRAMEAVSHETLPGPDR